MPPINKIRTRLENHIGKDMSDLMCLSCNVSEAVTFLRGENFDVLQIANLFMCITENNGNTFKAMQDMNVFLSECNYCTPAHNQPS